MERPYRQLDVERTGDVFCARLQRLKLDENGLYEFGEDLSRLLGEDGCSKLVFSLGPEDPQFLYSLFLAKLVTLQRRLKASGGGLKLCELSPNARKIFDVCGLAPLFEFHPDRAAAVAAFSA
jgi:anti-anti-sigma factor